MVGIQGCIVLEKKEGSCCTCLPPASELQDCDELSHAWAPITHAIGRSAFFRCNATILDAKSSGLISPRRGRDGPATAASIGNGGGWGYLIIMSGLPCPSALSTLVSMVQSRPPQTSLVPIRAREGMLRMGKCKRSYSWMICCCAVPMGEPHKVTCQSGHEEESPF